MSGKPPFFAELKRRNVYNVTDNKCPGSKFEVFD